MAIKRLDLTTISELAGGKLLERFQRELRRAGNDCSDRPGDDRARKVTLEVTLKPVGVINGTTIDCENIKSRVVCRCRLPDFETEELDFGIKQNGDVIFNPDSPADHRQATLLGEEDE